MDLFTLFLFGVIVTLLFWLCEFYGKLEFLRTILSTRVETVTTTNMAPQSIPMNLIPPGPTATAEPEEEVPPPSYDSVVVV